MSEKKYSLASLFHRAPATMAPPAEEVTQEKIDQLAQELATHEIDTRFRHALATGEFSGDIVAVDEQGNEIKTPRNRNNILGL